MAEIEVTIQMHLHDNQCGHLDASGNSFVPENILMVGDWFVYSAPGPANGQGIASEIRRNCRLIAKHSSGVYASQFERERS